jgi:hypothetical protein
MSEVILPASTFDVTITQLIDIAHGALPADSREVRRVSALDMFAASEVLEIVGRLLTEAKRTEEE